jgi:hypothetical protein
MGETITIRTGAATEVIKVVEQGPQGPVGPKGDPGDVAGLPLTTTGDTLYRANSTTNARLPIGAAGQVLKVAASGIPEWGNESGAVSSVAGRTGAVTLAVADVSGAVASTDTRLADSRQPTLHGSTHHTGETDALAAHQINGQTIFSVTSVNYSADQTLPANRARQLTVSNTNASGITLTLPTQAEGTLNGDTYVIVGGNTMSGPITVRGVANLSPLVYNTLVTITATGQQYRLRSGGGSSGNWSLIPVDTHTHTGSQVTVGTTANLPLKTGTNGVVEAGSFGTAAGSFCEGNDARLSDARTPSSTLAHKASHATGGTDALAPSDIGAQSLFTSSSITSATTLSAGRARIFDVSNYSSAYTIILPITASQEGDIAVFRSTNLINAAVTIEYVRPPSNIIVGTITAVGQQYRFIYKAGAEEWVPVAVDTHTHAASAITSGTLDVARLPVGTGSTEVAAGNHTHTVADVTGVAASGSITTSGLTQASARILGRTSASTGAVEEITIGSGLSLSAGELSATGGSGVTAVGASTADVLSVSGSDLVADDPNADRIIFWDDSESKLRYLEAGSGLSISGTTMTATSTFDPASPAGIGTTTPNTGAFTSLTGAPAANTAAYAVTGYSLTGSNAQSVIDLAGTWNTTGTPSAIKLNITDTASNAASRLFQVSVGGTERFAVRKDGSVMLRGGSNDTGGLETTSGYFRVGLSSGSTNWIFFGQNFYALNTSMVFGGVGGSTVGRITLGTTGFIEFGETESALIRDASHVIAQRRTTTAQEFRQYATFTSDTNFQRMTIKSVKQTLSALSGASATTTGTFIPDGAVVVGVTTRVGTALTGATGYTVGDGTDADRWGDITGTAIGTTSDNANWTAGTIECFTAGGNVTLTANGSNFTAGAIEICVFYLAGQAD